MHRSPASIIETAQKYPSSESLSFEDPWSRLDGNATHVCRRSPKRRGCVSGKSSSCWFGSWTSPALGGRCCRYSLDWLRKSERSSRNPRFYLLDAWLYGRLGRSPPSATRIRESGQLALRHRLICRGGARGLHFHNVDERLFAVLVVKERDHTMLQIAF
jgi:hypothetical protein